MTTAVVKRTSKIYNCKLFNLVTHCVFYRAAILGIYTYGSDNMLHCCTTCNNPTGKCCHLCQTHMEAEFLTNKSHKCRVFNSLLLNDLIEALTGMNLLIFYCERGSRITELELAVVRILWRD